MTTDIVQYFNSTKIEVYFRNDKNINENCFDFFLNGLDVRDLLHYTYSKSKLAEMTSYRFIEELD